MLGLNLSEVPLEHHHETIGVQVFNTVWPVQLSNLGLNFVDLQFWDAGTSGTQQYSYLTESMMEHASCLLYVCSTLDATSLDVILKRVGWFCFVLLTLLCLSEHPILFFYSDIMKNCHSLTP